MRGVLGAEIRDEYVPAPEEGGPDLQEHEPELQERHRPEPRAVARNETGAHGGQHDGDLADAGEGGGRG